MAPLEQPKLPYRPLEYWKPPKAIRHIRAKSSAIFHPGSAPVRQTFSSDIEGGQERKLPEEEMSFATIGGMRRKNQHSEEIHMVGGDRMGGPPKYEVDNEDTLSPHWWNLKAWRKRTFVFLALGLAIMIAVIVVIVVEVEKKNAYPDYSKLNYSLVDTCTYSSHFSIQVIWFSVLPFYSILFICSG